MIFTLRFLSFVSAVSLDYSIQDPISGRGDSRPTFLYDKLTPRPASSRSRSMERINRNPISGQGMPLPLSITGRRSKSMPRFLGRVLDVAVCRMVCERSATERLEFRVQHCFWLPSFVGAEILKKMAFFLRFPLF